MFFASANATQSPHYPNLSSSAVMPAKSKSGEDLKSSEMFVLRKDYGTRECCDAPVDATATSGGRSRTRQTRVRVKLLRATLVEKHVVVDESMLSYSGQPNSCRPWA